LESKFEENIYLDWVSTCAFPIIQWLGVTDRVEILEVGGMESLYVLLECDS